jgi:hypothetical protein
MPEKPMTLTSKRISTSLGLVCSLLLLAACASTPKPVVDYKQDFDFSGVQKIGFYKNSGQVTGDNPLQLSDFQKERIDNALANALRNKGLDVVDDPAQLLELFQHGSAGERLYRGHFYHRYDRPRLEKKRLAQCYPIEAQG